MHNPDNGRNPEGASCLQDDGEGRRGEYSHIACGRKARTEYLQVGGYQARVPKALFEDGAMTLEPLHNGLFLGMSDFLSREDLEWGMDVRRSPVQFGGVVSGRGEFVADDGRKRTVLGLGSLTQMVTKSDHSRLRMHVAGGVRLQAVGVDLAEDRMEGMLSGYPEYESLLGDILDPDSGFKVFHHHKMSPVFSVLASQMLNCALTGLNRKLYLESKALEIIALQLDVMVHGRGRNTNIPLSRGEMEQLHEARHVLFERMADPPGIAELAALVGLNQFKLKKGFREVFGASPYEALRGHRMEVARTLLLDGDMTVSMVASSVGYTNMSHFIDTFRKRFGATPGALSRQNRRAYGRQ